MVCEISPSLLKNLIDREVLLFLGAGASVGAHHPQGHHIPRGPELRDMLCNEFCGGQLKDRDLASVAAMVATEHSLGQLQSFVHDVFADFMPGQHHLLVPKLPWMAIATTNYDRIIEQAYASVYGRKNPLEVTLKDSDGIDVRLAKHTSALAYFKLHGCISKHDELDVPLILSSDQYSTYERSRKHLFARLENLATQFTVVFVGYRAADPHILRILANLFEDGVKRRMFYMVDPGLNEYDIRYWSSKRVTGIKATFEEFLASATAAIPAWQAQLAQQTPSAQSSLSRHLRENPGPSMDRVAGVDFEHVRPGMPVAQVDAKAFYQGFELGFAPIAQALDVRRSVEDHVLQEHVLSVQDASVGHDRVEFVVLKGPAGNGKSVALRRICWDAAQEFGALVLYHKEDGALDPDSVGELCERSGKRVFLGIDRVALSAEPLRDLLRRARRDKWQLSVLGAERDNEWNTRCSSLAQFVTESYPVRYLSELEIDRLLEKLATHDALGELAKRSRGEQKDFLLKRAERQLLVALHEATGGRPFEELIRDEYMRVDPLEARQLYLDICTLNRLAIPVRAGLIARAAGVDFNEFSRRFFDPLEQVVVCREDRRIGDMTYRARHPRVAEMVFEQALPTDERRHDQLARIVRCVNVSYSSDRSALEALMRNTNAKACFGAVEFMRGLYNVAGEVVPEEAWLLQQRGLAELKHAAGSLAEADHWTAMALERDPNNPTILHSCAEVKRRQALEAEKGLDRAHFRSAARKLLHRIGPRQSSSYDAHLSIALTLDELDEQLASTEESLALKEAVRTTIFDVEKDLSAALEVYADSDRLLMLEHRFHVLLGTSQTARRSVEKAFAANPRNEFAATTLAKAQRASGETEKALDTLRSCIEQNPNAKVAHLELGIMLAEANDPASRPSALAHLEKARQVSRPNPRRLLWYGRELFLEKRHDEAREVFGELQRMPSATGNAHKIQHLVRDENGSVQVFDGYIASVQQGFFFARVGKLGGDVFCHNENMVGGVSFEQLRKDQRVHLEIGFSSKGPAAAKAWLDIPGKATGASLVRH